MEKWKQVAWIDDCGRCSHCVAMVNWPENATAFSSSCDEKHECTTGHNMSLTLKIANDDGFPQFTHALTTLENVH